MEKSKVRYYLAIDLKSFYASVECVERSLDPMDINLVVADISRTEKTICLAVSPSLKAYGVPGRARLFEAKEIIRGVNAQRIKQSPDKSFHGISCSGSNLSADPSIKAGFMVVPPRMSLYMKYSIEIYKIYLKYVAPEDIHVYSIDEVFMDITDYIPLYCTTPYELAKKIINDVYTSTGITATAGIGTNLYLCKVAMDIVAKRQKADTQGVRIAAIDEMSYRRLLWTHRPITDFWRVGRGYAEKLASIGIYTMGDVARLSVSNENILYRLFGINAELLIDHAWGYEPCTMSDIKSYRPSTSCISMGQVLSSASDYMRTRLIVWEMAEKMSMELASKRVISNQMVLTINYDKENLSGWHHYKGNLQIDHYGRSVPKHSHGTINLDAFTSSSKKITESVIHLFERIVNPELLVRRLNLTANHVIKENSKKEVIFNSCIQLSLFSPEICNERKTDTIANEFIKEKKLQTTILDIRRRYGKNALLKGTNFVPGTTARERNQQIGGHKA